jgi:hypothetical protein
MCTKVSTWMKWTKLMFLSKICLHRRTRLHEWSEQSWCFLGQKHQLCSLHSCRRVRRCRQILDRSINFVHFIHVDVSDGVDKSWVNKAYASVQDLSTPSDTSTWMKWTKLMFLSKFWLHHRTRLHEWSEQSLCFCPRFDVSDGVDKSWTEA